jgi:hypothetical protein
VCVCVNVCVRACAAWLVCVGGQTHGSGAGLLKNQLKLHRVKRNGRSRVEIVPLQEQLSFDKVSKQQSLSGQG